MIAVRMRQSVVRAYWGHWRCVRQCNSHGVVAKLFDPDVAPALKRMRGPVVNLTNTLELPGTRLAGFAPNR